MSECSGPRGSRRQRQTRSAVNSSRGMMVGHGTLLPHRRRYTGCCEAFTAPPGHKTAFQKKEGGEMGRGGKGGRKMSPSFLATVGHLLLLSETNCASRVDVHEHHRFHSLW